MASRERKHNMVQDDITILIKTFRRPQAVNRLLASILQYYPDIRIVIIDDSPGEARGFIEGMKPNIKWLVTEHEDIGLSAGRNIGLLHVKTPYVFMCDDDCIFTQATNLGRAEELLTASGVDILGIDAGVGYCGCFETRLDTVFYLRNHTYPVVNPLVLPYDFVPNIFIAKTESLKQYKWDESLKMGEHFAYFYEHLGKIRVGFTKEVTMKHEHISSPGYDTYRGRATEYVKQYMRSKGIKRRITFDGTDEV